MTIYPWAIGTLVISDSDNNRWRSTANELLGLPSTPSVMAAREGRHPRRTGVRLDGRAFALETTFPPDEQAAARQLLLRMLDRENAATRRLMLANAQIAGASPNHVGLMMGPWDLYRDDSTWTVRDLLQPTTLEATLGGGWQAAPGEGVTLIRAATNLITNPSFETGVSGWVFDQSGAGGALSQSGDRAVYGSYSAKILASSTGAAQIRTAAIALADGATIHASVSAWAEIVGDSNLSIYDATNLATRVTVTGTAANAWGRLHTSWTNNTGGAVNIYIILFNSGGGTGSSVWFDAVVAATTPIPYFDGDTPGATWSGTAHNSISSIATGGTLTLDNPLDRDAGTLALWWTPAADETGPTRYLFDEGSLKAYFNAADDKIYFTDGTNTISTTALTWDAGDTLKLVFTWGDAGLAIYKDGAVAATGATYTAPALGATLYLGSDSSSGNQCDGALQEVRMLDFQQSATQVLNTYNAGASNARWLDVACEGSGQGIVAFAGHVGLMRIDGDVKPRSRDGDVAFWRVREASATLKVTNAGDVIARPQMLITPKAARTGGYAYKRYVPVIWQADESYTRYPYDLTDGGWDTASLVTAGKMQADGDDLRVQVDGSEANRWLANMNAANTKVWANLSFSPTQYGTLEAAIDSGDAVESLDVNEDISGFPSSGVLLIGDPTGSYEILLYTAKNDTDRRFLSVTRAARGTSAQTWSADEDVWWVQHEVWLQYGNGSATAPTVDDNYKPAFELDLSTNDSWVYETFGEDDGLRAGQWTPSTPTHFYGGNRGASADPWVEIGLDMVGGYGYTERVHLRNPCGITNANFTNGEKYQNAPDWTAEIESSDDGSSWTTEYTIPNPPSSPPTWESWSRNEALATGATYVALSLYAEDATAANLEAADCTVTLDSTGTPLSGMGAEQGSYSLDITITNNTTGVALALAATLAIDETLDVDTDAKTITYQGQSAMDAYTLVGGAREAWLALAQGENELAFSGTGTNDLEIVLLWDRRSVE